MSETSTPQFKLVVPITGFTIRKDAQGVEKYVLTGLASNTNIDLTGERMSKSAIVAMEKSLEANPVTLNNEHGNDWDDDFGEVTRLWSTDGSDLMMEAELDPDHYRTQTLIKALTKGKKLGLSIGGVVKDAAWEFVDELARRVMTYKDISLFHVAITGTPAVADTWVTPITKSMKDWEEMPMSDTTTKSEEHIETPTQEVVETPAAEDAETSVVEEEVITDQPTDPRPAEGEEPEAPAEGDKPDAPETDTTTKSETETAETPVEVGETSETATPPATPEAPEQKEDAPASAEATPAPAEEGTSEVAKSAAFGDYAEVGLVTTSIHQLSYTLEDYVWGVLFDWHDEGEAATPAAEKITKISAGLDDFKTLILKVATALVDDTNAAAVKSAHDAFKAQAPEAVAKSLTEKDAKVEELTKSLSDTSTKLEAVQKALGEKEAALETATKSLTEATSKIETIQARKAIVFDKFAEAEPKKVTEAEEALTQAQQKFASFITSGPTRS